MALRTGVRTAPLFLWSCFRTVHALPRDLPDPQIHLAGEQERSTKLQYRWLHPFYSKGQARFGSPRLKNTNRHYQDSVIYITSKVTPVTRSQLPALTKDQWLQHLADRIFVNQQKLPGGRRFSFRHPRLYSVPVLNRVGGWPAKSADAALTQVLAHALLTRDSRFAGRSRSPSFRALESHRRLR